MESWEIGFELVKLVGVVIGAAWTMHTFRQGLAQWERAELWKRQEFVAKEIKEFESDPTVRNVFRMLDYSSRRVNLELDDKLPPQDWTKVTREVLYKALLPH